MRRGQTSTLDQVGGLAMENAREMNVFVVFIGHEAELAILQDLELLEHDDRAHLSKYVAFHGEFLAAVVQRAIPCDRVDVLQMLWVHNIVEPASDPGAVDVFERRDTNLRLSLRSRSQWQSMLHIRCCKHTDVGDR